MADDIGGLLGLAIGTTFAVATINALDRVNRPRRRRRRVRRRRSVSII